MNKIGIVEILKITPEHNPEYLDICHKMRFDVFVREEGYDRPSLTGRSIDDFDNMPSTIDLLALYDGEPAGTMRVLFSNQEVAELNEWDFGLEMEEGFDLEAWVDKVDGLGEVPNSAVLSQYRKLKGEESIIMNIWWAAIEIAKQQGVSHYCARGLFDTDDLREAMVVYHLIKKKGLYLPDHEAVARDPSNYELDDLTRPEPKRRLYADQEDLLSSMDLENPSPEDLEQFKLPKKIGMYGYIGIRYTGKPMYDPMINSCGIPMFLPINDFPDMGMPVKWKKDQVEAQEQPTE